MINIAINSCAALQNADGNADSSHNSERISKKSANQRSFLPMLHPQGVRLPDERLMLALHYALEAYFRSTSSSVRFPKNLVHNSKLTTSIPFYSAKKLRAKSYRQIKYYINSRFGCRFYRCLAPLSDNAEPSCHVSPTCVFGVRDMSTSNDVVSVPVCAQHAFAFSRCSSGRPSVHFSSTCAT